MINDINVFSLILYKECDLSFCGRHYEDHTDGHLRILTTTNIEQVADAWAQSEFYGANDQVILFINGVVAYCSESYYRNSFDIERDLGITCNWLEEVVNEINELKEGKIGEAEQELRLKLIKLREESDERKKQEDAQKELAKELADRLEYDRLKEKFG